MHELPLHPLTITNLLMWPVENLLLPVAEWVLPVAQSLPNIDNVPDAFVKNWMIMMGFAVMIIIQIWTAMRGGQVQRRDVSGTLTTVPEKQHADKEELVALKAAMESLKTENASQHQAAAVSGQNRVMALSQVVDSETTALSQKIDSVRDKLLEKIEEGFVSIHDKLNAVAIKSERHDALLPPLVVRVSELERKHSDAVGKLHERLNDFISKHPTPLKR